MRKIFVPNKAEKGFTIVELLIASTVFSMVLLVCAFAIVHVGRMYYRGMINNRVQDVSRKIADDITRSIMYSSPSSSFRRTGSGTFGGVDVSSLCLGNIRYSYNTTRSQGEATAQVKHVLWKDQVPDGTLCPPVNLALDNPSGGSPFLAVEMLGLNMRLPELRADMIDGSWEVAVRVAYGETDDLFVPPSNNGTPSDMSDDILSFGFCKGASAGGQFCATSNISTLVKRRVE